MALVPRYRLLENGDRRLLESGEDRILNLSYPLYKGYRLFPFRANWADDHSEAFTQSMTTLDNRTGLHLTRAHTDAPIASFDMAITLVGRTDINAFRSFVRDVKGRQQPMWVPTWMADLKLIADTITNHLDVESVGYTANLYPHVHRKHLAVVNHEGLIMPRKILVATDNGTQEDLTLNAAVEGKLYANASLLSFLLFARLDSDSVRLTWNSTELAEARLGFIELPPEAPTT